MNLSKSMKTNPDPSGFFFALKRPLPPCRSAILLQHGYQAKF